MRQNEVLEVLESVASDQWGIITTAQAQREGITRLQLSRLADKGVLARSRHGIYLLPSAQHGALTNLRTAWVSLGAREFPDERWESEDKILVSHESAALIHQVGDLIPRRITFSSTTRKQTSQEDIYIYSNREINSKDIRNVDGLPVTSVELTVSDLAEKKIEFNYLATMVVDALRKENVRMKDLATKLNDAAESYGFSSGQQLVQECQREAASDDDREESIARYASLAEIARESLGAQMVTDLLKNNLYGSLPTASLAEIARESLGAQMVTNLLKNNLYGSLPTASLAEIARESLNQVSSKASPKSSEYQTNKKSEDIKKRQPPGYSPTPIDDEEELQADTGKTAKKENEA